MFAIPLGLLLGCLLALVLPFLAGCGGGGGSGGAPVTFVPPVAPAPVPTYQHRLVVQPADAIVNGLPGYGFSMQSNENPDAAMSVAEQSQQGYGSLILTIGDTKNAGFRQGDVYLREVVKYPKFTHVYLYDELFHTPEGNRIGKDEEAVSIAARMVRDIGLKTAISITPGVILDPAFRMADANAFDVIAVDVYPAAHAGTPTPNCARSSNEFTNILACSVGRLRALGYRGEVWYAYQAFGVRSMDKTDQARLLEQQRETVRDAPSFGVVGLAAFGLFLSRAQQQREPDLYPGAGSDIEALVTFAKVAP